VNLRQFGELRECVLSDLGDDGGPFAVVLPGSRDPDVEESRMRVFASKMPDLRWDLIANGDGTFDIIAGGVVQDEGLAKAIVAALPPEIASFRPSITELDSLGLNIVASSAEESGGGGSKAPFVLLALAGAGYLWHRSRT